MVRGTVLIDDDRSQSLPSSITEDDDRRKEGLGSPAKRGVAGASPEMRGDPVLDEGEEECLVCRIRDVWLHG
ncbi:cyclic nucleotide-gated ion channel 1-like [Pyrus ussuriensis x Pyrus communis]|uniref:Cyclic nucleotide-gated ion channel 1-like n=1 Tax=Pyrus ussuriensis x Pyrus communis TaxID=2448454 RepID=A0A5N5F7Q0_9ROSA|nr:cyclic nucleotide-gated ion channel 1-like [Pyrus ussuriensis x Pyrus communis]